MIDKERVAVLIGKNGQTKELIERLTNTKIDIDSNSGNYRISPKENSKENIKNNEDTENKELESNELIEKLNSSEISSENITYEPSFSAWITQSIIEAINIGFTPEKALKLLDQKFTLEIINLEKLIGNNEKKIKRISGRIIGENGRMRSSIEQFSGVYLTINTKKNLLGLIGDFECLKVARKSIEMLTNGLPHKVTLNFLQKKYRERKQQEFNETWKPTFE